MREIYDKEFLILISSLCLNHYLEFMPNMFGCRYRTLLNRANTTYDNLDPGFKNQKRTGKKLTDIKLIAPSLKKFSKWRTIGKLSNILTSFGSSISILELSRTIRKRSRSVEKFLTRSVTVTKQNLLLLIWLKRITKKRTGTLHTLFKIITQGGWKNQVKKRF